MKMGYFLTVIGFSLAVLAGQWVGTVNARGPAGDYRRHALAARDGQGPAGDNAKRSKDNAPTTDQQKMNAGDRDITKRIRSTVSADKSLSTYAHNVKIITQNGKVARKGPVRSDEEKSNIGSKAAAVIGDAHVDNQLQVVPAKQ